MTGPKSKRVCMIAFTHYPFDGRVRLEAESLVEWGYEVCFLVPKEKATATTYMLAGVIVKELNVVDSNTCSPICISWCWHFSLARDCSCNRT
jgi:hypothetical protein